MCGRYAFLPTSRLIFEQLDLGQLTPRFNIAPSQQILIIRQKTEAVGFYADYVQWGLIPFWAKEKKIGNRMINARAETIAQKPAFRAAFKYRRCLIPSSGFYEWSKRDKKSMPYFIKVKDEKVFAFAGLWESWREKESGELIESATIITIFANAMIGKIHDRMPVIIPPNKFDKWLDSKSPQNFLLDMLQPYDADLMEMYSVGILVNNPKNDVPECMKQIVLPGFS